MESLRKRMDLKLVTNPTRAKKLIARPTTLHWDIITENLVSIKKQKPEIIVDRPIYLGFSILELSKTTMYKFHYEDILSKYGSRAKLAYGLFHISHPNARPLQGYGAHNGCVWHFWLSSRLPPPLEAECQGPRQDEGRMLEFGTPRICWTSCQNVQHSPPQW